MKVQIGVVIKGERERVREREKERMKEQHFGNAKETFTSEVN